MSIRPKLLDGGVDDRLPAFGGRHRCGAGHGLTTGGTDLGNHVVGRTGVDALPADRGSGIVDDDLGALRREQQGVGAAQPPACAGDHGNPAVEPELGFLLTGHFSSTSPSSSPVSRQACSNSVSS